MNQPNTTFPTLTTARLTIRQGKEADAEALSALRSNDTVNFYLLRPKQTTIEEAKEFISKRNEDIAWQKVFYWVVCLKDSDKVMATVCLKDFSEDMKTAELGYEMLPEFHGQGLMTEVVQEVLRYGTSFGFEKFEAFTHRSNARSIRLLEKHGFKADYSRKDEGNEHNVIFVREPVRP